MINNRLRKAKVVCVTIAAVYTVLVTLLPLFTGFVLVTVDSEIFRNGQIRGPLIFISILAGFSFILSCVLLVIIYFALIKPYILFSGSLQEVVSGKIGTRIKLDGRLRPGSLMHDFNMLMNFVQENVVELSVQYKNVEMLAKRYKIAAEYANSIIFDYSIHDCHITFNDNFFDLFGYVPPDTIQEHMIIAPGHIHADDLEEYREFCIIAAGTPGNHSTEVRLQDKEGSCIWCLVELTSLCDSGTVPERAIGRITDISSQKQQYQEMEYRAQIDLLTGFYNKLSGKQIINDILSGSSDDLIHAMLVFDIDDFKDINDKFGHLYGDAVIVECSDRLRNMFPKPDILCRFGGDEYVVFLCDVPSREFAVAKAEDVTSYLEFDFEYAGNKCHVSMSAGLSFFPDHGKEYEILYEKSDQTLYFSKRNGKHRSMVYNDAIGEQFKAYASESSNMATDAKGFSQRSFMDDAAPNIFNLLYESTDIKQSVRYVLSMLVKAYGIDAARMIILDGGIHVLAEAAPGNADMSGALIGDKDEFRKLFENNNEFCCKNINTLTGHQRNAFDEDRKGGCLYIALPSGVYALFDTFQSSHVWDVESRRILLMAVKIIDVFLNK